MLFVYNPQTSSPVYYDQEEAFAEYRRREYIAALQEQQRRVQFEQELALEEERHRRQLEAIAQQEIARRQRAASARFAPRTAQQHTSGACTCGHNAEACIQPDPQEIFRRRQARQQEEERLSRDFHKNILTQIFGVPPEQVPHSTTQGSNTTAPSTMLAESKDLNNKGPQGLAPSTKEPKTKNPISQLAPGEEPADPHWSGDLNRTRSLGEVTSISRTFTFLKNMFVFPSGPLERIPESNPPRLAYNSTNTSIHAYQHALSDLLSKLDSVESYGFKGLREARKQLVVKIEGEMDQLEKKITERLTDFSGARPVTISSSNSDPVETQPFNEPIVLAPTSVPQNPTADAPQKLENDATQTREDITMGNAEAKQDVTVDDAKTMEDVTMDNATEVSPPEAAKEASHEGAASPEKSNVSSVPEVVASTEIAPLEPQKISKDATSTDPKQTSVASASNLAPSASTPKKPTFSVEDDDSEIEDAVKTCSLA